MENEILNFWKLKEQLHEAFLKSSTINRDALIKVVKMQKQTSNPEIKRMLGELEINENSILEMEKSIKESEQNILFAKSNIISHNVSITFDSVNKLSKN